MELLRSWGLEDAVRAGGVDVDWTLRACATLATAAGGPTFELGFPTRGPERGRSARRAPACVPQDHLEPVLLDHLRGAPHGRAELGTEVVGIEHRARRRPGDAFATSTTGDDAAASRPATSSPPTGPTAASAAALGIELRGPDHLAEVSTALFRAPLWDVVGDARHVIYGVDEPEAGGVFLPAGGDRLGSTGSSGTTDAASAEPSSRPSG